MYLVKSKNLSIPLIKTGMNIKGLVQTGLYHEILKRENYQLTDQEIATFEHAEGIF
jgi:hypothetical protein